MKGNSDMLHAVLLMPPELWDGGEIGILHRHERYVKASRRIGELESALMAIYSLATADKEALDYRHVAKIAGESLHV